MPSEVFACSLYCSRVTATHPLNVQRCFKINYCDSPLLIIPWIPSPTHFLLARISRPRCATLNKYILLYSYVLLLQRGVGFCLSISSSVFSKCASSGCCVKFNYLCQSLLYMLMRLFCPLSPLTMDLFVFSTQNILMGSTTHYHPHHWSLVMAGRRVQQSGSSSD